MKAIFNLSKNHYLRTVSIFLIAVMLIVGVVSCGPSDPSECIDNDGDGSM